MQWWFGRAPIFALEPRGQSSLCTQYLAAQVAREQSGPAYNMLQGVAAHLGVGQASPKCTPAGGGVALRLTATQSAADSQHTERPFVRADPVLTPEHLEFWEDNGEPTPPPSR